MEQIEITLANDQPGVGKAGDKVMLELKPADVHDPVELATYVAGYRNFGYRADDFSPPILREKDQDKYRTFDSDDAFLPVTVKGSLSGAVPEVDPESSLATYTVQERFVGSFIPREVERQADTFSPRAVAGKRCMNAILMDREIDVFGSSGFGQASAWLAGQQLVLGGTQNWNGGADSDPIKDLHTAIEASAQPVTDIWMNQKVSNTLLRHDKVRDHMRQMLGDNAVQAALGLVNDTREGVSRDFVIPGLPPIHVIAAKSRSVSGGALSYILPDVVLLSTKPAAVPTDAEEVATSYTFRRRGAAGVGLETREFELLNRGPHGGTMIVVSLADVAERTARNAGGIITNVIA